MTRPTSLQLSVKNVVELEKSRQIGKQGLVQTEMVRAKQIMQAQNAENLRKV